MANIKDLANYIGAMRSRCARAPQFDLCHLKAEHGSDAVNESAPNMPAGASPGRGDFRNQVSREALTASGDPGDGSDNRAAACTRSLARSGLLNF